VNARPNVRSTPFRSAVAFTLVEIMVVVVIIGLLAALGIPALKRSRERSLASRVANDFHQFDAAFQRYALESGQWPPAAGSGGTPTGMDGYLPANYNLPSPFGGTYVWSGPSHNIVLRNSQASDAIMRQVDAILDDGNLATGDFGHTVGVGFHLLVR
jgi:prepilin-type N-terminal cleavage/methylation domain-containing protein